MAAEEKRTRYILMLSVEGGWPDESLVPRPDDIERELQNTFARPLSVQAVQRAQNLSANVTRYYELSADPGLAANEIKDMLVLVLERVGAETFSGVEVHVVLATSSGANVAEGTARPQPR